MSNKDCRHINESVPQMVYDWFDEKESGVWNNYAIGEQSIRQLLIQKKTLLDTKRYKASMPDFETFFDDIDQLILRHTLFKNLYNALLADQQENNASLHHQLFQLNIKNQPSQHEVSSLKLYREKTEIRHQIESTCTPYIAFQNHFDEYSAVIAEVQDIHKQLIETLKSVKKDCNRGVITNTSKMAIALLQQDLSQLQQETEKNSGKFDIFDTLIKDMHTPVFEQMTQYEPHGARATIDYCRGPLLNQMQLDYRSLTQQLSALSELVDGLRNMGAKAETLSSAGDNVLKLKLREKANNPLNSDFPGHC